jgi:cytochrome bd-type quinol oxidase subunit 1
MDLDPVLIARLQFAFTIIFHIIFPAFTIGLSAYIATLCVIWMRTGKEHYRLLARFWTKIFAVSFALAWYRELSCRTNSAPIGAGSPSRWGMSSAR